MEAVFTVLVRVLKGARGGPALLVAETVPSGLACVTQSCMAMQERGAARAVLLYVRLVSGGEGEYLDPPARPAVTEAVRRAGPELTLKLLMGVCGGMPSWTLNDLVQTLVALCCGFGAQVVTR